jgi:alkanesulfonate monooxygenase SsuD/methylene tetrahydromethanopterin reductase-like flavin-dependent oxidoreductase (luciferase family)
LNQIDVGLMLPTIADSSTGTLDTRRIVDTARQAETAGFAGVYVGDHLLHPRPILESIVTLSIVAGATTRVMLGPCVLLVALRQPLVLAKQLGTLAAFAPGRLRVGVGVGGEYPGEFEVAGVPLAGRGQRMEDALRQLRSLLNESIRHDEVTLAPTTPLPLFVGGWSDAALRRAATHADGWIGYLLTVEGFAKRRAALLERTADRPFSTGMLLPVHVDVGAKASGVAASAWARLTGAADPLPDKYFVAGSVDDIVGQMTHYVEAGCDELVLAPADQGAGFAEQVDLLAADVLPRLRLAERRESF